MEDHDWHMFDVVRELEVKCEGGNYHIHKLGAEEVFILTPEEFDKFRSGELGLEGI